MAITAEPLIFDSFKGIRELNGVNSGGQISAIECKNVDLVQTEIGSNTGIRTMKGNTLYKTLDSGYDIIGIFKSVQDGVTYKFYYAEDSSVTNGGKLYYSTPSGDPTAVITGLKTTGQCNGITMSSSAYDVFIFTNGEQVRTVCFSTDPNYANVVSGHNPVAISGGGYVSTINPVDYQGRALKWLTMTEWNGFLVVGSQYGVGASHQNDIYTWNDNPTDAADSWYIDFSKKVTAVYSYTKGLYIFTNDDITFINTTPNDTSYAGAETVAGVGCFSYQSIVKHDLNLFFYDVNQKNIYYIENIDTGQIRPNGPVARELQSEFNNVIIFKMYSCIYKNKNEVWAFVNDKIFIYNFFLNEWVQRIEPQKITTLCLSDNVIYSGTGNKIYTEMNASSFAGQYITSEYRTTYINLGSNSNLKKQKTPLLLVLDDNHINDFWVELTVNGKVKNPKRVKVASSFGGVYASADEDIGEEGRYDTAIYVADNPYSKKVVEISTPQTWYTMGIRIYTDRANQGFYILSMELKNIKVKLKTRGR